MQQKPPTRRDQKEANNRLKLADKRRRAAEAEQKELEALEKGEEIRRRTEKARTGSKTAREEERLSEAARKRHLREARRKERDERKKEREERKKERAAYRETHPGFYNPSLRLHSFLAAVLAVVAIFFVATFLFKDSVGTVGSAIAYSLLGWFSYTAYLLPLFMIVHAVYWRKDVRDRVILKKAIALLPMLVFASSFAAMLAADFSELPISAALAYELGNRLVGGGVVGEFVARTLCRYIGALGLSIIGIAFFIFFLALYFRTTVKSLYVAARAKLKASMVERAKRRAARKEGAEPTKAATKAEEDAPAEAPLPENKKKLLSEANAAHREEITKNRRRALFADLEEGLDVDRSRLPSGNRERQLFDFEAEGGTADTPSAPTSSSRPTDTLAPTSRIAPRSSFSENADFSGDRLTVTRERIRPVRVTPTAEAQEASPTPTPLPSAERSAPAATPPTRGEHSSEKRTGLFRRATAEPTEEAVPNEHSGMDYFRSITVAATREEESTTPPPAQSAYGYHRTQVAPAPEAPVPSPLSAQKEEAYDSFTEDEEFEGESLIADIPQRPAPAPAPAPTSAPAPTPVSRPVATAPRAAQAKPMPAAAAAPQKKKRPYQYPPLSLLALPEVVDESSIAAEIQSNAEKLVTTLDNFKVRTQVTGYSRGPRITRYEVVPDAGVRVRTIAGLVEDISMSLATSGIRIEAPIPGKSAVGVEVPNTTSTIVRLRALLDNPKFRESPDKSLVCLGSDVAGMPVYCDLAKMPHLLVAGATGMGKSVCINSIITSILYKASPDEVKLIMIDPKKVEFAIYSGIPHLLVPVVTDPKKAAGALSWAVAEMERRFDLIEHAGVRDIKSYNREMAERGGEQLPKIIIIIDELHDLMMSAADAVETSIARIAAKARAAGIHLLIGTQRPSVDVITGTIKANIPSRIAFHVSSNTDSRTILDFVGAEKLLTQGDMLFSPAGAPKPLRVQGAFVDDKEIDRIVDFLKTNNEIDEEASERIMADIEREAEQCVPSKRNADEDSGGGENVPSDYDDHHLLWAALEIGFEFNRLSTSLLQRKLKIGYGKAAKILDELYERGYITEQNGAKPREIRITREEFKEMKAREVEEICGGDY